MVSRTYAWFTMNKEVSVQGMQVKAQAEAGLLINEVKTAGDDYWDESATALVAPGTALVPTSTTNATKWFHANSRIASDEAGASANQASTNLSGYYEELTLTEQKIDLAEGAEGTRHAEYSINYSNNNGTADYQSGSTDNAYFIKYKYYMRVSKDNGLTGLAKTENAQNVAIKKVDVTLPQTQGSEKLNKALRVGVMIGGKMYIYAPVYGAGQTSAVYYATTAITNTTDANSVITGQTVTNQQVNAFAKDTVVYTALTALPGLTGDGEEVDIYVWFEGEDENCKSENITDTLDNIEVSVTFGLETLTAANAATAATVGTGNTATVKNEF